MNRRSLLYLDNNGVQVGHDGPEQNHKRQQRKLHGEIGRAYLLDTAYIGEKMEAVSETWLIKITKDYQRED